MQEEERACESGREFTVGGRREVDRGGVGGEKEKGERRQGGGWEVRGWTVGGERRVCGTKEVG